MESIFNCVKEAFEKALRISLSEDGKIIDIIRNILQV